MIPVETIFEHGLPFFHSVVQFLTWGISASNATPPKLRHVKQGSGHVLDAVISCIAMKNHLKAAAEISKMRTC
ncbi:MAG: hypothetical protein C5B58_02570 [Acidobacteria bacterium]|nr:MAG: hypothetical protein C5B58_02570 [Acidobacteriota bacterium]